MPIRLLGSSSLSPLLALKIKRRWSEVARGIMPPVATHPSFPSSFPNNETKQEWKFKRVILFHYSITYTIPSVPSLGPVVSRSRPPLFVFSLRPSSSKTKIASNSKLDFQTENCFFLSVRAKEIPYLLRNRSFHRDGRDGHFCLIPKT